MNRNTLLTLLAVPFLHPEGASTVPETPRPKEVVEHTVQVVRQEIHEKTVAHSTPEAPQEHESMSQKTREKLLALRRREKNSELGFKKTAQILQTHLRQKGFLFECKTNEADPSTVGLSFQVDETHVYYLSLPEEGEIDPDSEYNVLFEEYEKIAGEWYPTDHEIVKSNALTPLKGKIFELLGGEYTNSRPSESTLDAETDY